MALEIAVREVKDITVVDLDGKIVLGRDAKKLRETIKKLLADGKRKILLNAEKVADIDSTGVGTLVASFTSARTLGGELKLNKLNPKFRQALLVTRLLTVFEVYDNETEAVAKFQ